MYSDILSIIYNNLCVLGLIWTLISSGCVVLGENLAHSCSSGPGKGIYVIDPTNKISRLAMPLYGYCVA